MKIHNYQSNYRESAMKNKLSDNPTLPEFITWAKEVDENFPTVKWKMDTYNAREGTVGNYTFYKGYCLSPTGSWVTHNMPNEAAEVLLKVWIYRDYHFRGMRTMGSILKILNNIDEIEEIVANIDAQKAKEEFIIKHHNATFYVQASLTQLKSLNTLDPLHCVLAMDWSLFSEIQKGLTELKAQLEKVQ